MKKKKKHQLLDDNAHNQSDCETDRQGIPKKTITFMALENWHTEVNIFYLSTFPPKALR